MLRRNPLKGFKMPPSCKICRVTYFSLLGMVCIASYYSFFRNPADGGPPGPGDGLLFFFQLIVSNLIILPLCLRLWRIGFHETRFRKTVLIFGLFVIDWPILLLLCAAAFASLNSL